MRGFSVAANFRPSLAAISWKEEARGRDLPTGRLACVSRGYDFADGSICDLKGGIGGHVWKRLLRGVGRRFSLTQMARQMERRGSVAAMLYIHNSSCINLQARIHAAVL